MSTVGNIVIEQNTYTSPVVIYVDGEAHRLPYLLKCLLIEESNYWLTMGPDVYTARMARIIFRDDFKQTGSVGISTWASRSGDHPWILVKPGDGLVEIFPTSISFFSILQVRAIASWTFEGYCKLDMDSNDPWSAILPDGE